MRYETLMQVAAVTAKGQTTIPVEIRHLLDLHSGDKIGFVVEDDEVVIRKIRPFDYEYHKALAKTLSEWDTAEDDDAYADL